MTGPAAAVESLWTQAGGDPAVLKGLTLTGADPILPTDFAVGTAAAALVGAATLAAAEMWRLATGRAQAASVDVRAAVAAFRSERYLRVDGEVPADPRGGIFGFYRAGDGRWVQLHGALPHHREGIARVLGCELTREAAAAAVARWSAPALEDAMAAEGLPAVMVRSRDEWQAHPQGRAVAGLPVIEIERIGEAPPVPVRAGARPLGGVRVLELTRVIAGPVCGRALAAHGADVLLITAAHLANLPRLVIDTGFGKRSAWLDLRRRDDADRLRALIAGCDVVCQSYRPGALDAYGFSPDEVARLRPGVVYVTLSAYGRLGPWRGRRGFETLVQSATGMAHEQGFGAGLERPEHLPAQVVDHGTGYLGALGAMTGLARRAREGGSHLVRVSLAQTARWVDALGRVDGRRTPDLAPEAIADLLAECDSPFGRLRHVVPAGRLAETPPAWTRPPVPPGTDAPAWADAS
jgi:crotonobetainyl-CoA:carnitine CoA-transferase CaiB-like acyl-CoA transferase